MRNNQRMKQIAEPIDSFVMSTRLTKPLVNDIYLWLTSVFVNVIGKCTQFSLSQSQMFQC